MSLLDDFCESLISIKTIFEQIDFADSNIVEVYKKLADYYEDAIKQAEELILDQNDVAKLKIGLVAVKKKIEELSKPWRDTEHYRAIDELVKKLCGAGEDKGQASS